jgi:protein SCO1
MALSFGDRTVRALLALVGVAALAFGGYAVLRGIERVPPQPPEFARKETVATVVLPPLAVPEFRLVDAGNRSFTRHDLEGRWSLMFFGYTHCPDVCPMTLKILARAQAQLRDLPPDRQPRVVFVSVDPARDTPAALASYVGYFGAGITGVTGGDAELARLTQPLGIAYRRTAMQPGSRDYTVDHSATLLFVDGRARVRAVLAPPHVPDEIAADYRKLVAMPEPAP